MSDVTLATSGEVRLSRNAVAAIVRHCGNVSTFWARWNRIFRVGCGLKMADGHGGNAIKDGGRRFAFPPYACLTNENAIDSDFMLFVKEQKERSLDDDAGKMKRSLGPSGYSVFPLTLAVILLVASEYLLTQAKVHHVLEANLSFSFDYMRILIASPSALAIGSYHGLAIRARSAVDKSSLSTRSSELSFLLLSTNFALFVCIYFLLKGSC